MSDAVYRLAQDERKKEMTAFPNCLGCPWRHLWLDVAKERKRR